MSNRFENLKELKKTWNIEVEGINNYPSDGIPSVIIANHSCLMDIFYLPACLLEPTVSLISARILFKKIVERQNRVNKYLYALPIEAHGGGVYANIGLEAAVKVVQKGISVNIFPEGAYVEDRSVIYRGRTGAARILFKSREKDVKAHFVPVAIDVQNKNLELDSFDSTSDHVRVKILEPIHYEKEYEKYLESTNEFDRNLFLHEVTDRGLKNIALALGKTYHNEYIALFKKGNVIFRNGSTVPTIEANQKEYLELYQKELTDYTEVLCRRLIKK